MFDLGTLLALDWYLIEAKAKAEGREPTAEEYGAAMKKTWDAWMEASVSRDMIRAGFVRDGTGWRNPRRGLWETIRGLFGGRS